MTIFGPEEEMKCTCLTTHLIRGHQVTTSKFQAGQYEAGQHCNSRKGVLLDKPALGRIWAVRSEQ